MLMVFCTAGTRVTAARTYGGFFIYEVTGRTQKKDGSEIAKE
jgi:hypothetical protein